MLMSDYHFIYYFVREVSGSILVRESEGVKRKFHFQVTSTNQTKVWFSSFEFPDWQVEDRGVKVFPPGTSRAVL